MAFLYSKVVGGKRKIYYAATGRVTDDDKEVVYKDSEGNVLTIVDNDTYVDDGHGGVVRLSDDKTVIVYSDESTPVVLIPQA